MATAERTFVDTDILIDVARRLPRAVQFWRRAEARSQMVCSVISVFELLAGCRNLQEQRTTLRNLRGMEVVHVQNGDSRNALQGIAHPKYLNALTLEEKFRLPYLDEATRVYDLIKDSLGSRLADSFIPRQEELAGLVSTLKSPWIDSINSVESFESVARLASVGKALLPTAYDAAASDTLKSLLGDWSHVTLSESVFSDWRVRQQLYLDYGFDKLLTVLPEPAFTDSLFETRILRYDLFPSGQPVVEPEESDGESFEEYRWKQRVLDAHGILLSLEDGLRIFIHKTMTERFGPGWEKRHVSGEVYKAWVEKRETARNNGGKENRLLWYADFTDYIKIIERGDNWKEVFEPIFRNKMDVPVSFQRLGPIRVSAAHYHVVTKEDYLLLSVESQRILKAIGMIDNLN